MDEAGASQAEACANEGGGWQQGYVQGSACVHVKSCHLHFHSPNDLQSDSALALSQAEASTREAESSSKEHLEDLLARMEARERWLAGERVSLDAKIREATAPATTGRDNHLQAAKALRSEVEALR